MTADAVRYYEREGLLPEPERSPAGYRQYPDETVGRLRFIRGAQSLGLKLGEIRELLEIRDRGACPCGHPRSLVERRLAAIDEELKRLRALKRELVGLAALECPADARSTEWPCEAEFMRRGGERVG